jgi:hypothetical protein
MGPRTWTLALVLAALAPVSAGCDGGSGSDAKTGTAAVSAPPPPSQTATSTASAKTPGEGKVDLPKAYTQVVADVQSRLNALGRKLPKASTFGSAAFAGAASGLAGDVHRAAGVLGAARPPYPVRALHASVLHQLQSIEDDFRALAQASDTRDLNAASDALSGVSTALARVQSDIRRIKARVK